MIDAITTVAASSTGPSELTPAAPSSTSDVERFRQVLFAPSEGAQPNPSLAISPAGSEAVSAPPKNLGEAIISTLQTASTDMSRNWSTAAQMVAQPNLTMADMLRLQMTVIQSSIQYELLGKAITKSTNNLDQILKTQ